MFALRALARPVMRLAWQPCLVVACALLAGCSMSALDILAPKPGEAAPVVDTSGPKRAWSALQSADAQPVWPVGSVPAAVSAVPQASLDALTLGMNTSAVNAQLGAPHGMLKDPNGDEVWQYVVADGAGNRAYIASFWFGPKGMWLASGRSRPVGQLAGLNFGAPTLAAAPAQLAPAPAPVAAAKPAPGAASGSAPVSIAAAPPSASAKPVPADPAPAASPKPAAPPPAAVTQPAPPATSAQPAPRAPASPPPSAAAAGSAAPASAASTAAEVIEEAALREALAGWLQDWSSQNVAGYLARYTSDFVSPGKPRDEWEKERRSRVSRPKFIRVKAEQVKVRWPGSVRPQLEFVQRYESNTLKDTSLKVLTFVKRDGRWLIEQEDSAPLPLSR